MKALVRELVALAVVGGLLAVVAVLPRVRCSGSGAAECALPVELSVPGRPEALWCGGERDGLEEALAGFGLEACAGEVEAAVKGALRPSRVEFGEGCFVAAVREGMVSGRSAVMLGVPVDLNRSSAGDLEAVPGIGPVLAARIVEHRERHGPFCSVEALRQVEGIGRKKLEWFVRYVVATCDSPTRTLPPGNSR